MKQAENIPIDTNQPGMQPNAPAISEQEKQQHRHEDDQNQTPPQKPVPPEARPQ